MPNHTFEVNDCHLYVKHHHYHSITQQQESDTACPAGKYVLKCLLSPDVRQLATASADKTVKLWNLDGFTLERTLTGMLACLHMQTSKTGLALCICILEFSTMIRLSMLSTIKCVMVLCGHITPGIHQPVNTAAMFSHW